MEPLTVADAADEPVVEGGMSKNAAAKAAKKAAAKERKLIAKGIDPAEAAAALLSVETKPTISLEPPTGTRDFYPQEMRVRSWLFGHFREVARQFAFQEYDAPVLEYDELYKRKAGEEITDQMYNFTDKVRRRAQGSRRRLRRARCAQRARRGGSGAKGGGRVRAHVVLSRASLHARLLSGAASRAPARPRHSVAPRRTGTR